MASGVAVPDDLVSKFNEMKKLKDGGKSSPYRYLIYKIKDDKSAFEIEAMGEGDKTYEDFKAALNKKEARFASVDVPIKTKDGVEKNILCLITWSPDDECPIKLKMLYSVLDYGSLH